MSPVPINFHACIEKNPRFLFGVDNFQVFDALVLLPIRGDIIRRCKGTPPQSPTNFVVVVQPPTYDRVTSWPHCNELQGRPGEGQGSPLRVMHLCKVFSDFDHATSAGRAS